MSGKVKYSDCFCRAFRLGNVQKNALASKHAHCFWLNVTFFLCCFFKSGTPWWHKIHDHHPKTSHKQETNSGAQKRELHASLPACILVAVAVPNRSSLATFFWKMLLALPSPESEKFTTQCVRECSHVCRITVVRATVVASPQWSKHAVHWSPTFVHTLCCMSKSPPETRRTVRWGCLDSFVCTKLTVLTHRASVCFSEWNYPSTKHQAGCESKDIDNRFSVYTPKSFQISRENRQWIHYFKIVRIVDVVPECNLYQLPSVLQLFATALNWQYTKIWNIMQHKCSDTDCEFTENFLLSCHQRRVSKRGTRQMLPTAVASTGYRFSLEQGIFTKSLFHLSWYVDGNGPGTCPGFSGVCKHSELLLSWGHVQLYGVQTMLVMQNSNWYWWTTKDTIPEPGHDGLLKFSKVAGWRCKLVWSANRLWPCPESKETGNDNVFDWHTGSLSHLQATLQWSHKYEWDNQMTHWLLARYLECYCFLPSGLGGHDERFHFWFTNFIKINIWTEKAKHDTNNIWQQISKRAFIKSWSTEGFSSNSLKERFAVVHHFFSWTRVRHRPLKVGSSWFTVLAGSRCGGCLLPVQRCHVWWMCISVRKMCGPNTFSKVHSTVSLCCLLSQREPQTTNLLLSAAFSAFSRAPEIDAISLSSCRSPGPASKTRTRQRGKADSPQKAENIFTRPAVLGQEAVRRDEYLLKSFHNPTHTRTHNIHKSQIFFELDPRPHWSRESHTSVDHDKGLLRTITTAPL